MNVEALQIALDELTTSGDSSALWAALMAEGWSPPRCKESDRKLILAQTKRDESGCWVWTGVTRQGYGQVYSRPAHRVSYEAFIGLIPKGLVIDHVCRNRSCVRPHPEHLEPVTPAENDRRARAYVQKYPGESVHNGAKRWCKHGHEYTEKNTGLDKLGKRFCRACRNEWKDRWRARLKESQPAHGGRWHIDGEAWLAARESLVPALDGPRMRSIEVAALWGISPVAFNEWRSRHPELLRPLSGGGRGVPFLWSRVEAKAIMAFQVPIRNALGYRRKAPSPLSA